LQSLAVAEVPLQLTRWGESGSVYGFLEHLDCRSCAEIVQSIATEARQQMVFRQFEGLFTMPFWHLPGIPQAFAWTLLSPCLAEYTAENPRIELLIFLALAVANNPNAIAPLKNNATGHDNHPAITHNRTTPLSHPGFVLNLKWEGTSHSFPLTFFARLTASSQPRPRTCRTTTRTRRRRWPARPSSPHSSRS
jgi:hypothetical protein